MRDQNDHALVERLRGNDEHALADLSSQYGPRIYQLAFRYMRNHEDAEEVVQDVLMKVFRKIELFRGDSALSSWIYRITFNTAMSRLRSTKAMRLAEATEIEIGTSFHDDDGASAHDPADWSSMADEAMLRRELRERLVEAVSDLPAIYREPVILRDLRGMSTEEASTHLRVKDQTLKSRLHRGRMLLREQLADFASGLSMREPTPAEPFRIAPCRGMKARVVRGSRFQMAAASPASSPTVPVFPRRVSPRRARRESVVTGSARCESSGWRRSPACTAPAATTARCARRAEPAARRSAPGLRSGRQLMFRPTAR